MSDSAWIMGPECKTVFIVKVYTMHDVDSEARVRSILLEAGDLVPHLTFLELSAGLVVEAIIRTEKMSSSTRSARALYIQALEQRLVCASDYSGRS